MELCIACCMDILYYFGSCCIPEQKSEERTTDSTALELHEIDRIEYDEALTPRAAQTVDESGEEGNRLDLTSESSNAGGSDLKGCFV